MKSTNQTSFIIIYLSILIFMVYWSSLNVESSPVASNNNGNWETDANPSIQSKQSSSNNNLNDLSDRMYRIVYKRLADTVFDPYDNLDDASDRFDRQERHLRFGKRFSSRSKYSDLDYGHMRFGRR